MHKNFSKVSFLSLFNIPRQMPRNVCPFFVKFHTASTRKNANINKQRTRNIDVSQSNHADSRGTANSFGIYRVEKSSGQLESCFRSRRKSGFQFPACLRMRRRAAQPRKLWGGIMKKKKKTTSRRRFCEKCGNARIPRTTRRAFPGRINEFRGGRGTGMMPKY